MIKGNGQQITDHLDRYGGCEVCDQIGFALRFHRVEESVGERDHRCFHVSHRARIQGARDDFANTRVQRWVVKDQARRVVLIEQSVTEFRAELCLLVGRKKFGILVHGDAVVIAREEIAAIWHPGNRRMIAQGVVSRIGVGNEVRPDAPQIERARNVHRLALVLKPRLGRLHRMHVVDPIACGMGTRAPW